jgi:hypothetical protein
MFTYCLSSSSFTTENLQLDEGYFPAHAWYDNFKDSFKFSFFCRTIKDWNKLPEHISNSTSTEIFTVVYGSQTEQQYSSLGRTRDLYALSFTDFEGCV